MKTKPISIRFDEEKLKFFQEKFPEINKPQKVVDYFLDNFWWRHHQSEVSPSARKYPLSENEATAAPISARAVKNHDPDKKIAPIQRKTTPAVNIKNFTNDKTKQTRPHITNPQADKANKPHLTSFQSITHKAVS